MWSPTVSPESVRAALTVLGRGNTISIDPATCGPLGLRADDFPPAAEVSRRAVEVLALAILGEP